MKELKDEKTVNFNQMIGEIENEVNDEIKNEKEVGKELFKDEVQVKNGIMSRIWKTVLFKLLGSFKVKITLYYNDKVVFEYEIPKN